MSEMGFEVPRRCQVTSRQTDARKGRLHEENEPVTEPPLFLLGGEPEEQL